MLTEGASFFSSGLPDVVAGGADGGFALGEESEQAEGEEEDGDEDDPDLDAPPRGAGDPQRGQGMIAAMRLLRGGVRSLIVIRRAVVEILARAC